jgi:hypothetical protein
MPLAAGTGALVLSAAPAAAQRIRERAADILRDGAYQAALPQGPKPPRFDLPLGPIELLLRILLWTSVAVLAALAVAWIVRRLSRAPADVEVPETSRAAPAEIGAEGAEALAAKGRWAEAIHALLLDTLEALSRAALLAPSLTSREIVARVALPPRAHDALAGLVTAVEISRFGGATAGEDDYRTCLDRFRAFAETYRSAA